MYIFFVSEITPPEGYKSLSNSVKFVINDSSDRDDNVIEIMNEKNSTTRTSIRKTKRQHNIPQTGDIALFLLFVYGIAITLVGFVLVRSNKCNTYC